MRALGTSPAGRALLAVTYLGPAAQIPRHCLAGCVVPHELVILAGYFGQQLLYRHWTGIGKTRKLLGIHRAAESTDEAFAIQEGDYDPDNRSNHGSLQDGGTHVPGAGERDVSGQIMATFSSSRALMDAGCPTSSSPTPSTVLSIAPATASSALGSFCWCFTVESVPVHWSALCATCIYHGARSSHYVLLLTVYLCIAHSPLSSTFTLSFLISSFSTCKITFLCSLSCPTLPACALGKTVYVTA